MEIVFLLIEPAVPENVGAAARALKTMGFGEMRLVNTVAHQSEKARWLAHGAGDLLQSTAHYDSFEEAARDLDYLIATTSKSRSVRQDYHSPERVLRLVESKKNILGKVGVVFGSEESGLSNAVIAQCDIASTIPLAGAFPSLNLAQSVMLYAYIFARLPQGGSYRDSAGANQGLYATARQKVSKILQRSGLPEDRNLHRRILERIAAAGQDDIHLMLSVCNRLEACWPEEKEG